MIFHRLRGLFYLIVSLVFLLEEHKLITGGGISSASKSVFRIFETSLA